MDEHLTREPGGMHTLTKLALVFHIITGNLVVYQIGFSIGPTLPYQKRITVFTFTILL